MKPTIDFHKWQFWRQLIVNDQDVGHWQTILYAVFRLSGGLKKNTINCTCPQILYFTLKLYSILPYIFVNIDRLVKLKYVPDECDIK